MSKNCYASQKYNCPKRDTGMHCTMYVRVQGMQQTELEFPKIKQGKKQKLKRGQDLDVEKSVLSKQQRTRDEMKSLPAQKN